MQTPPSRGAYDGAAGHASGNRRRLPAMNMLEMEMPLAGSVEAQLEQLSERLAFVSMVQRKRAATMVFVGALMGFLGFAFACVVGVVHELDRKETRTLAGKPFASGYGYFPATVSEQVHQSSAPEGKIFFAFCFIGALLIFFSWYPKMLRNVYIGDDPRFHGISWVDLRQYIPVPGMMMLSIITTVPSAQAGITDYFCIVLHLVGALMLFVGYFCCEAYAIGWGPFRSALPHRALMETQKGRKRRIACITGIAVFYAVFCLLQVILMLPIFPDADYDHWEYPAGNNLLNSQKELVDTARGTVRLLKITSYASEVICGLFLLLSHLTIWYTCEERHYDLDETLAQPREVETDVESHGIDGAKHVPLRRDGPRIWSSIYHKAPTSSATESSPMAGGRSSLSL